MTTLKTFILPAIVTDSDNDIRLGRAIVAAWQKDGIIEVTKTPAEELQTDAAFIENECFFNRPLNEKTQYVSDLTYSGYVASGAEQKGGKDKQDFPEVFTIFPDVPQGDARVRTGWPCHGPVTWPGLGFQSVMTAYINSGVSIGHRLLQLAALGLGYDKDAFMHLVKRGGWNYMRVLQFPAVKEKQERGIGSHTDYDLLVISSQEMNKEGLWIRPPIKGEHRYSNWLPGETMTGFAEDDNNWIMVPPNPGVFTVFPADMMQLLTGGRLLSTPHKVARDTVVRRAMPVFIGPDFDALLRPIADPDANPFCYGEHVTRTHMNMYRDRSTTKRIEQEDRLERFLDAVHIADKIIA